MKRNLFIIPILLFVFLVGCEPTESPCIHNYETKITDATCVSLGKKDEICTKCGYTISYELPKGDHMFGNYVVVKNATCLEDGLTEAKCNNCNHKISRTLSKKEHEFGEFIVVKNPTCIEVGLEEAKCINCDEKISNTLEKINHNLKETIIEASCENEGYTLVECNVCDFEEKKNYTSLLDHKFSDWEHKIPMSELNDGLDERVCTVCQFKEQKVISSLNYIDLDVIKFKLKNEKYTANSFEELQLIFDSNIFNEVTYFEVEYNDSNASAVLNKLVSESSIDKPYHTNLSVVSNIYKFTVEYYAEHINRPVEVINYKQLDSLNKTIYSSSRSATFDDFKINNSLYSYNVETSEQLFYCLERRVLPICKSGSVAETIYNLAKNILRSIIDDNMNDFEKIKAIHDWIIMNVTYDEDLLQLTMNNASDLYSYKGFYLEGVFIDGKAVCEGISKAFCVLANIEGIPCIQVDGIQTQNPGGVGHAWNKVYLEGKWYVLDATSDGVIVNNETEVLTYTYFLISNEQMKVKYTETEFENIICGETYDSFGKMSYVYKENKMLLKIENIDELVYVIDYFEHSEKNDYTLQFEVEFDFGESIVDELKTVYQQLEIYKSFNYLTNGDLITLICKNK